MWYFFLKKKKYCFQTICVYWVIQERGPGPNVSRLFLFNVRASSTENTLLAIRPQIVTPRARRISVYKNRRKRLYVWTISGYISLFGVGRPFEDWQGRRPVTALCRCRKDTRTSLYLKFFLILTCYVPLFPVCK